MSTEDPNDLANPHRTTVDEERRPHRPDEDTPPREEREWREVAEEVKQAVEDADGPLE
ncbi:hypothetical protein [Amycolatopsis alkalitolerans]|uniref:hypothetical protein n=1 Tax=Amycolatopsis alkalitolerans TaxID=2547244 RepID=UPI001359C633|nr:hypothetical protein [Amycolatopsis alkalitolerans]